MAPAVINRIMLSLELGDPAGYPRVPRYYAKDVIGFSSAAWIREDRRSSRRPATPEAKSAAPGSAADPEHLDRGTPASPPLLPAQPAQA